MPRPQPYPILDPTKVDFPSDRLTLKELRRLFPDIDSGKLNDFDEIELPGMLSLERDLAKAAFDAAFGKKHKQAGIFVRGTHALEEDREMLARVYVRYGLASGPHQAAQMIHAFEQAAATQAAQHVPDLPPR